MNTKDFLQIHEFTRFDGNALEYVNDLSSIFLIKWLSIECKNVISVWLILFIGESVSGTFWLEPKNVFLTFIFRVYYFLCMA